MKIHITGHHGFIAVHLRAALKERGHSVTGSGITMATDPAPLLANVIKKPDLVIHAGALVGRLQGERNPNDTIFLNATSTAVWARSCHSHGVPMLYLSSSEVYGDLDGGLAYEDLPYQSLPYNLYGLTKRWGEEVCRLYVPYEALCVARLSMPYGPGHPPGAGRAAMTNFLHAAMNGKELVVHEGASRSWCYVTDTVAALVLLAEHGARGTYNVGRDDNETSMVEVARKALDLCDPGWHDGRIRLVPAPDDQVVLKRLPTIRIRALGWEPEVELYEGMALTKRWLERY